MQYYLNNCIKIEYEINNYFIFGHLILKNQKEIYVIMRNIYNYQSV